MDVIKIPDFLRNKQNLKEENKLIIHDEVIREIKMYLSSYDVVNIVEQKSKKQRLYIIELLVFY